MYIIIIYITSIAHKILYNTINVRSNRRKNDILCFIVDEQGLAASFNTFFSIISNRWELIDFGKMLSICVLVFLTFHFFLFGKIFTTIDINIYVQSCLNI